MKSMKPMLLSAIAIAALATAGYGLSYGKEQRKDEALRQRLTSAFAQVPDSVFESIRIEDLLDDEVYIKLAQDGWTPDEIRRIMNTVMRDKRQAKSHTGYGNYAKQWLPTYGVMPGGDIDRRPGYFRETVHKPSGGRIHWIVVNQNDPAGNQLYVAFLPLS